MNRPYNEIETRQQTKTYAHTLDAVNYILRRLDFPAHKLRDVVDGLQGAAGGRGEFYLSHLALARRLRHAGKDETAEAYARRKVAALKVAQRKTGRMLFTITEGGGIEHKRTHYVDHLTPVAVWMMQQARASELWETHPGKAIEAFTEAAIEMLPPAPVEDKQEREPMPIEDDLYIQRMINQSINCAVKACDRAAENGGDDLAIAEMAIERMRRYIRDRHNERAAASNTDAGEGLQICHPSDSKEDTGRLTNLSPFEAESPEKPDMLAAALAHAGAGKPVFPVRVDKTPLTANGFKGATTDEQTIRKWWRRWPDAGIGIPTGKASGLLVLDIDPPHGGYASLCDLLGEHNALPETREARTGGGGIHYVFEYPQGVEVRNSAGKLGGGIDVRGEGGYIIAPPSLHASGQRYARLNDHTPAPVPDWLLKLLTEERHKVAAAPAAQTRPQVTHGAGPGGLIAEGSRNDMLFKIGCSVRGGGAEYAEVEAQLLEANARRCVPALPVEEVQKIARSAMRYAPNAVAVGA